MNRLEKIKTANKYIKIIRRETSRLESLYKSGKISYQEYFFKLSKLLKGKTEAQWYSYYSNYIKAAEHGLSLPSLQKPSIPVSINPKIIVPLLILIFSIIAITFNEYTGFVVLGNEELRIHQLSIIADKSGEYKVNLTDIPTSLRLSGILTGQGAFNVYIKQDNKSLLIADNSVPLQQLQSGNVTDTNISISYFNDVCIETCRLSNATKEITLLIEINNATLSLTNLTYTTIAVTQETLIEQLELTGKESFESSESPEFSLEYEDGNFLDVLQAEEEKQKDKWQTEDESIEIKVYNNKGEEADLPVEITKHQPGKFTISLEKQRQFKPGKYKAVITLTKGLSSYTEEKIFYWGVLAINTHKSRYLPNENSFISMAVLDDNGKVVCDANLTLNIKDPSNKITTLATGKDIIVSPECKVLGVTKLPDYYTNYQVSQPGIYTMNLFASHKDGTNSISSNFSVEPSLDFDVARDGPTRIFPVVPYKMNITIKANKPFSGSITEYVPSSFEISPQQGLSVSTINDTKALTWAATLASGETRNLYYEFDAPDISPFLFLLGKLTLADYSEFRYWQIASDVPGTITDTNVSAINTKVKNINVTKNSRVRIIFHFDESVTLGQSQVRTWIEYALNTTLGDDSDAGTQVITGTCGSNAFKINNVTPSSSTTDSCPAANARCMADAVDFKVNITSLGKFAYTANPPIVFGIENCGIAGSFDIGIDADVDSGAVTLDSWANVTVAKTLFIHPNPSNASRRLLFTNATIPEFNQTVNLSSRITNEFDLNYSIFSTNLTGSWRNWSIKYNTGTADNNIVNWTKLRINVTNTKAIGWRYYANDSSKLPNASIKNILYPTDTLKPRFRNLTNNNRATYFNNDTTPTPGQVINLSINIIDNGDISHYRFSTNNTGSWTNRTWVSLSGTQSVYTNWTRLTTSSTAGKYGWRYYANDSLGNLNASAVNTFSIEVLQQLPSGSSGPKRFREITVISSTTSYAIETTASTTSTIQEVIEEQRPGQPDLANTSALILAIILIAIILYEIFIHHLTSIIRGILILSILVAVFSSSSYFSYIGLVAKPSEITSVINSIQLRYIIAIDIILLIYYIKLLLSRKPKQLKQPFNPTQERPKE